MAGGIAQATRLRRGLLVVLILAAATLVIVTESSLANLIAKRWVREDQFPDSGVSAVVVLSGGVNPNGTISSEALDHLIHGVEIMRSHGAKFLVTTSRKEKFPGGVVESTLDQSRIVSLIGADSNWRRTAQAKSTRDEAVQSAKLLLPGGWRSIAVIASPMHTRRACSAFEAVGFQVTCVPARLRSPGAENPGPWPDDRLAIFGQWIYEIAATAKYRAEQWTAPSATPPLRHSP
jgi:uncharacterized SAM-binding protein YcdF (DUF218 family)